MTTLHACETILRRPFIVTKMDTSYPIEMVCIATLKLLLPFVVGAATADTHPNPPIGRPSSITDFARNEVLTHNEIKFVELFQLVEMEWVDLMPQG